MEEPTKRQREVLKILVREYIATGVAVGSSAIAERYPTKISSATVRSEVSRLEDEGYLIQPHTSAGRLPTDKGYRFFVEQLMDEVRISPEERRTIQHQFHQVRLQQEQWLKLAAAVLAHSARTASLVTAPRGPRAYFRHVELVSVSDFMGLMILILQDGTIGQEMLVLTRMVSQDELTQLANRLNDRLHDQTSRQVAEEIALRADAPDSTDLEKGVLARVREVMQQVDRQTQPEIYRDGLLNILKAPGQGELQTLQHVVAVLEQQSVLESVIGEILRASGVQVIIGGEGRWPSFEDMSLVLSRYGITGEASGVLGVVGPTRMHYGRAVSTVRYVSTILTDLLERLYGREP